MEPMHMAIVAVVAIVLIGVLVFLMTRGGKKSRSQSPQGQGPSTQSPNAALAERLASIAKELEDVSKEIDVVLESDEETFSNGKMNNPGKMNRYDNVTVEEIFNALGMFLNYVKFTNDEVKVRSSMDQGLESDKALMESMLQLSNILATITNMNNDLPQLIKETKKKIKIKIKADQNTAFNSNDLKDTIKKIRLITTPLSYLSADFLLRVNDEIRSRPSFCSDIASHMIDVSMDMPAPMTTPYGPTPSQAYKLGGKWGIVMGGMGMKIYNPSQSMPVQYGTPSPSMPQYAPVPGMM